MRRAAEAAPDLRHQLVVIVSSQQLPRLVGLAVLREVAHMARFWMARWLICGVLFLPGAAVACTIIMYFLERQFYASRPSDLSRAKLWPEAISQRSQPSPQNPQKLCYNLTNRNYLPSRLMF